MMDEKKIFTEEELKAFVSTLQKINSALWTEKLWYLLDFTIWTFYKQYDDKEEFQMMGEDITKYIWWWAEYITENWKNDIKYREELHTKLKDLAELKKQIKSILYIVNK